MATCTVDEFGNNRWVNSEGKLHKEDGPAIEYPNGDNAWYLNGKLHRDNGPAAIYSDGNKVWWFHGKLHREDDTAIIYADGYRYWYLDGINYSFEDYVIKAKWSDEQVVMYKLEHY